MDPGSGSTWFESTLLLQGEDLMFLSPPRRLIDIVLLPFLSIRHGHAFVGTPVFVSLGFPQGVIAYHHDEAIYDRTVINTSS